MTQRPNFRTLVGVGLVAGSTLALQVLLTRLFSAVLFYHFGFLAISLALLGTGAGGLILYVRPQWFSRRPLEAMLARWAAALAVLFALVPIALVRIDFSPEPGLNAGFVTMLALACTLAALPFGAAGVLIALAIRDYARAAAGRVYAADLAGAGLGAAAVVPALRITDPATLIVCLGVLAGAASLLFASAHPRERRFGVLATAAAVALIGVSVGTSLLYLTPVVQVGTKPYAEHWTPLSRVLGYAPPKDSRFAILFYDRVYAPVPVRPVGAPYPDAAQLGIRPQGIGYAMAPKERALVIGGGGGRDIYNALSSGERHVDVIELNRGIVDMVDKKLVRWSGAPYSLPRVSTSVGDGRSILASRDTKYDQVHIGFTDTLSANSATAFALTESNLYTVEAFDEYFDHLRPDGVLNVSRLYRLVGDEALRTTVLALDALKRRGVAHPERNVVVILGHDIFGELFGTTLARPRPWTEAELTRVRRMAAAQHLQIAYAPGGPYRLEWAQLARAPSYTAFCEGYRLDVCAPTDNKPFFFNMKRLGDVGQSLGPGYIYAIDPFLVLVATLGVLAVLCLLAFALPLFLVRSAARPRMADLSFFAAIGVGFLMLEVVLIQRFVLFLGFPTYALSVVLFAMLVFTGAGALLAGRVGGPPRRSLMTALAAVAMVIVVAAFGLQPLLRALIELPFAARVAVTVALLAPLSVGLGMAMPIGLRRLSLISPGAVPWAWAINGVTSVLASALAVAVAITAGFTWATLAAAACYLAALAHAAFGRWPEEGEGKPPEAVPARESVPAGAAHQRPSARA